VSAGFAGTPALLQVKDLVAGYGRLPILHGVSLSVSTGEVVTLIGPNGSGKSTLLKAVCGLADVQAGSVNFSGRDISRQLTEVTARAGVGYVPQRENVFPGLSVHENLELGSHAHHDWRAGLQQIDGIFELFPVLYERRAQQAGTLSGGERQMLAMGRALLGDPKLMLLDEPSAALAPKLVDEIFRQIERIRERGVAILLAEQNASQALEFSDVAHVLISGELAFSGTGPEILNSEEVIARVLGTHGRKE
jgi:ABC-type branched-subunit amino acid transport system ATPase component